MQQIYSNGSMNREILETRFNILHSMNNKAYSVE